jgi:uncharacterized protein (TIGR03437 family)
VDYIQVQNGAGGVLRWTVRVAYQNSSGWLRVTTTDGANSGVNNGTVRVDALPGNLAPGVYKAILTIDAGPLVGSRDVAITLTITPAPVVTPPPPPAPGSIAVVMGNGFSGANLSVTIDSVPAHIFSSSDTQIMLLIPDTLGSNASAQLVVQVNGISSGPQRIALAPFAPGIFQRQILNQDDSVNGPALPAWMGSIIQVFATGLPAHGLITAKIGNHSIGYPYYAGPAPGQLGVELVDLILPPDLTGSTVNVTVCGGASIDQMMCSPPVPVSISQ